MATVTINIRRQDIYYIAEGISITISQHNGGTPTYEQLWASKSEARKLDIYYREAIGDLERRLMTWEKAVSAQFDMSADGSDYTLQLDMSRYWPPRLEGLLANKIQDYLVHAVTAGWLNDFAGLDVKQDYQAMAATDLTDIREIIHQRGFDFPDKARAEDTDEKDVNDGGEASARGEDTDEKDVNDGGEASARGEDTDEKDVNDGGEASSRAEDTDHKDVNKGGAAGKRKDDHKKDMFVLPNQAGFRNKDDVVKDGPDDKPFLCRTPTTRHKDNAIVQPRTDWTDMSGTGIAYRDKTCPPPPTRPMMGMGYTPQPDHHLPPRPPKPCGPVPPHRPCGCRPRPIPPAPNPHKDPKIYPEPPYHAVPPKYPPIPPKPEVHATGKDWSDMDHYDEEAEKKFINSHDCGQHDCETDVFGFADGEENTDN